MTTRTRRRSSARSFSRRWTPAAHPSGCPASQKHLVTCANATSCSSSARGAAAAPRCSRRSTACPASTCAARTTARSGQPLRSSAGRSPRGPTSRGCRPSSTARSTSSRCCARFRTSSSPSIRRRHRARRRPACAASRSSCCRRRSCAQTARRGAARGRARRSRRSTCPPRPTTGSTSRSASSRARASSSTFGATCARAPSRKRLAPRPEGRWRPVGAPRPARAPAACPQRAFGAIAAGRGST